MAKVYAGTSGWAYAQWKPGFYPAKLPAAKFLSHYATRLNSVEVNYTFRRFPSEKLLRGWIDATPAAFRFAVKAHQKITHFLRLRYAAGATSGFLGALEPLRATGKLGPVLFQLPPNLKFDLPVLKDFLAGLPRDIRACFEFRHESWFCDDTFKTLRDANAALCQAESEDLECPRVTTADFSYLRLRKESYSPKERRDIAARVNELAGSGDVFVYFKHEDTPDGALYAADLLKANSP